MRIRTACLALALILPFPQYALAQSPLLLGAVEDSNGLPVQNARIDLLGSPVSVYSDAKGKFRIDSLRAATYVLYVRRLGYAPVTTLATLTGSDTLRMAVELSTVSTTLATVVIEADRSSLKLDRAGFVQRRLNTTAPASRFITRTEWGEREPLNVSEILRRMGGFAARCPRPSVLVDGMRISAAGGGSSSIDMIPPKFVEAIEAYAGPSEMPIEFRGGECLVLIWTRD
jgi:hypothetical protein